MAGLVPFNRKTKNYLQTLVVVTSTTYWMTFSNDWLFRRIPLYDTFKVDIEDNGRNTSLKLKCLLIKDINLQLNDGN